MLRASLGGEALACSQDTGRACQGRFAELRRRLHCMACSVLDLVQTAKRGSAHCQSCEVADALGAWSALVIPAIRASAWGHPAWHAETTETNCATPVVLAASRNYTWGQEPNLKQWQVVYSLGRCCCSLPKQYLLSSASRRHVKDLCSLPGLAGVPCIVRQAVQRAIELSSWRHSRACKRPYPQIAQSYQLPQYANQK